MIRRTHQITLQALADATGLTKGYLSKIENSGKAAPVSTLLRIARALEVSPAELFQEANSEARVSVVRRDRRVVVARGMPEVGYSYESLCVGVQDSEMLAYVLTIPAMDERCLVEYEHEGQELLFVIDGRMALYYGDELFQLEPGDSAYFDAATVHRVAGLDGRAAQAIMVASASRTTPPASRSL